MATSVKDIKQVSIPCEDRMLVTDARKKGVTELSVPRGFHSVFCTRNGMLAFFDEKEKLYVTRWTSVFHGILENAGYKRANFQIPFEDGKVPFDDELLIKFKRLFK